jgi:plastocyanin
MTLWYAKGIFLYQLQKEQKLGKKMQKYIFLIILNILVWAAEPYAATLNLQVENVKGEKIKDAVIYAMPYDHSAYAGIKPGKAIVDQINKQFVPYVTAIYVGSEIFFPNHDQIRHNIYSFSEAKQFEIPLYKGVPAKPVLFDKPGVVALGCNIHDWMKAYIFVSRTPFFTISDNKGQAKIVNLPAGKYDVQIWHPNLQDIPEKTNQVVILTSESDTQALAFKIKQKKSWKSWRAPKPVPGPY